MVSINQYCGNVFLGPFSTIEWQSADETTVKNYTDWNEHCNKLADEIDNIEDAEWLISNSPFLSDSREKASFKLLILQTMGAIASHRYLESLSNANLSNRKMRKDVNKALKKWRRLSKALILWAKTDEDVDVALALCEPDMPEKTIMGLLNKFNVLPNTPTPPNFESMKLAKTVCIALSENYPINAPALNNNLHAWNLMCIKEAKRISDAGQADKMSNLCPEGSTSSILVYHIKMQLTKKAEAV